MPLRAGSPDAQNGISSARRIPPQFLPAGSNVVAKLGLQYERKAHRELLRLHGLGFFDAIEHNPWFAYTRAETGAASACCSPDFLLTLDQSIYVIEVKLTWVPEAAIKLADLYVPLVQYVFPGHVIKGLVVCRSLTPAAPKVVLGLKDALFNQNATVLHWPNIGRMIW